MGFTYVRVLLCNPSGEGKQSEVELLVDTGAIISVIPRHALEALEIRPIGKRSFRTFGGNVIEREIGIAVFKYEDAVAGVQVAFGEEGEMAVLGATALETLGYQVDPVTKQLKPVELLLL